MRPTALAIVLVVAACGDKKSGPATSSTAEADRKAAELAAIAAENAAPVPPKAPPAPSRFEATVDLTFTGAIDKKLDGPVGICGATFFEGKLQGGNYGIRTDELEFQILALTDDELDKPKLLLNVFGKDRKSFVGRPGKGTVTIDVARGATVDAELKDIVGTDTVKVAGTITCGPDYRRAPGGG